MEAIATSSARGDRVAMGGRPPRLTAVHHKHLVLGATMIMRDGWQIPASYGAPAREMGAIRDAVGLLDIGDSGKIDLKGTKLEAVLTGAFGSDVTCALGRVTLAEDAVRVCRLTAAWALVLTTPPAFEDTEARLIRAAAEHSCCHVTDLTSGLCGLRLLGPRAAGVLERVSSLDLAPDRFADGTLAQGGLARVHALVARRDRAGVLGYDLFVDRDLGAFLWDALVAEGGPLGLVPVGRDAEESLG